MQIALTIALAISQSAIACNFEPKTELERVYCEVQDRGAGQGLPSIFEFRKNPPQTQALLLKKPAQRLGLEIPTPGRPKTTARPDTPTVATEPVPPQQIDAISPQNKAVREQRESISMETGGVANCELDNESIVCKGERYILQTNLQNRQLDADALTEKNQLSLPSKTAPEYRDESVQRYLSSIYPYYLKKMLRIGLGDATMSFTKFAATYEDITGRGDSFTQRFAKMYELLKTERKSNSVKARYNNSFPASIAQCMRASQDILVCDDIRQNWIYRKE